MTFESKFHDAKIESIAFSASSRRLTLGLINPSGEMNSIICERVKGFDFTPFCEQNILFEVNVFRGRSVPEHIMGAVLVVFPGPIDDDLWVLELDSSAGMGGVIIADSFAVGEPQISP